VRIRTANNLVVMYSHSAETQPAMSPMTTQIEAGYPVSIEERTGVCGDRHYAARAFVASHLLDAELHVQRFRAR
jgi:hypothetical protein